MITEVAGERFFQGCDLDAHPAAGHLRHDLWVPLPGDQRLDHLPARGAVDVGDHRTQLDLRVFEDLLQPLIVSVRSCVSARR